MRVLYVEDNPRDADLIRRHLARHAPPISLEIADRLEQARSRLDRGQYDLALIDLHLPDGSGLDLLAEIRAEGRALAVIILTGAGDEETAVTALKAGADDYLVKRDDFLDRLPLALDTALARARAEAARGAQLLRVLYAEHHAADRDLTQRHLARHTPRIRLEMVYTAEQVLQRLPLSAGDTCPCHVLLLDYRLPGLDALELLKTIRTERQLDLPVVLVTGQGDEEVAVQALRLGASDYLVKNPGYLYQLPVALENAYHRTQLAREQAALRESEARFRRLAENAQDLIYRVRLLPERRFEYVSPAATTITGYSPEDHYADPDLGFKLVHPDDRHILESAARGEIAPDQPIVLRWVRKDGTVIWIEQRNVPILDEAGNLTALEGIARDITDRKTAEETLQQIAQRLALATGSAHMGIWEIDIANDVLIWDPQMHALYGIPPEKFGGNYAAWEQTVHPEDRVSARTSYARALKGEEPFHTQFRIVRPDSQMRTMEAHAVVQHAPDGQPQRMTGVNWDVTKRVQDEQEREKLLAQIQEQMRRVQQIIDTVPAGMLLLDADQCIVLANRVAHEDLPLLAGVQVGDTLTRLGGRALAELLTSPPQGLWHEVTADSRVFQVISRPILGDPDAESWVLVLTDVTQERQIRSQLQQQERLAAVGQLAAGIAHDFNNIMAVIVLYAQMARRSNQLPADLAERLSTIEHQTKRATNLIQQILDFSRSAVLDRQPLDLIPFIKELAKLLERTLPESISIELSLGTGDYVINADPTRVQQALLNLAINARDAMPEGGTFGISLDTLQVADRKRGPLPDMAPGTWIRLQVKDSGTGIPTEVLPHIFEPFFTTKAIGQGTGLGLAQVYGIISQHGGRIDVHSAPGHGTSFILYLPALEVEKPVPVVEVPHELILGLGETVLVVEDNEAVRAALRASLDQLNYRVLEAANGREALAILGQQGDRVDVVLSDVVMPVMGGVALLQTLRDRGCATPVVLMTGHPMERELKELRSQGLSAWLLKPPGLDPLAQALARALGRS